MKKMFSISELPLSLTSKQIINKINYNITYNSKKNLLKEFNIRVFLGKYKQDSKETDIKFNNYSIEFFNQFTNKYLKKADIICNEHTLDYSIMDVNLKNEKYEESTTTYKGEEKLRDYKIGTLRGMPPNGGVIEEICVSTAKTHDLNMSEDMILNSNFLKRNDFLLMDRRFLDIEFFKKLNKKGIKIIILAKKI